MTRDETVALFLECEAKRVQACAEALARGKPRLVADNIAHDAAKAHWNAWAEDLLAERKAMEADGRWSATINSKGRLVPNNTKTQVWMQRSAVDFSRCIFLMHGEGWDRTVPKDIEKEKRDEDSQLPDKIVQLAGDMADFSSFGFPGTALFHSVIFTGKAGFSSAIFSGDALFDNAIFSRDTWFGRATFSSLVKFENAVFSGDTSFDITIFTTNAVFDNATFTSISWFRSAKFAGIASFKSTTFKNANFASATFAGIGIFRYVTFTGNAEFNNGLTFERAAYFDHTRFDSTVSFAHCDFRQHATFEASHFDSDAAFTAMRGERGFSLAGAAFEVVPDFVQAHFEEAPRLDNLWVGKKLPPLRRRGKEEFEAPWQRWHTETLEKNSHYRRLFDATTMESDLRNIPARWRTLKRLAIQGHDTERELDFHARDIRSQRFVEHWPLPWFGKSADVWKSVLSFWFGYFYGAFSNFGRSLIRPAGFWLAAIALGAMFYVSRSPHINQEISSKRRLQYLRSGV